MELVQQIVAFHMKASLKSFLAICFSYKVWFHKFLKTLQHLSRISQWKAITVLSLIIFYHFAAQC
uniref:26S proteasome non-ATPase regulatory subunit 2 1A n=1 Tax=Rhizophora mucronata TaxID=61149 RepID=A0A2P2M5E6_RHIMU